MTYPSSLAYCRRVVRHANSSFPLAFSLLPKAKREAMAALYAYFRLTDDLVDGNHPHASKLQALSEWRTMLSAALDGHYTHKCHAALHRSAQRFDIPIEDLEGVIDGAERDLSSAPFDSFTELSVYCHQVASTVGRACIRVWGATDLPAALNLAVPAGIAFQLTNILRDLGEDLDRGRVYLPRDELERFGSPPEFWQDQSAEFRALMRFQTLRVQDFYRQAEPLHEVLSSDGRAVYGVIAGIYQRLLAEIERRNYDVFSQRVRVSKGVKARLLFTAWSAKWSRL